MGFVITTRLKRDEEPIIFFDNRRLALVRANFIGYSDNRLTPILLESRLPVTDAARDGEHGQLGFMMEDKVWWFYTGLGKGQTQRDIEALAELVSNDYIEFRLPIMGQLEPLNLKFSLDGFAEKFRNNLGPTCDWKEETES